jgi:hypothetical protein
MVHLSQQQKNIDFVTNIVTMLFFIENDEVYYIKTIKFWSVQVENITILGVRNFPIFLKSLFKYQPITQSNK